VSLVGQGQLNTVLQWNGSSSGTLLSFQQNKYFEARGFGVRNGGSAGTTIGIALEGPGSTGGTSTLIGALRMIQVSGFDLCMKAGAGDASSEILYEHVGFENCGTGWRNFGLNTLDHVFQMATCSSSTLCFQIDSGNAYIDGGSFSNNTQDIQISGGGFAAAAAVSIRNVRSEGAGTFVSGGIGPVLIEDNMVVGMDEEGSGHAVDINAGDWLITNNRFDGDVNLTDAQAPTVVLINNTLKGDNANNLPVMLPTSGGVHEFGITASNNRDIDSGVGHMYQDARGMTQPILGAPFYRDDWSVSTVDRSFPAFPLTEHRINIQTLGERQTADGKNLRVGVVFDSDDTATFTFARTVTIQQDASTNTKYTPTSGTVTKADIGKVVSYSDGTNTFHTILKDWDGSALYFAQSLGFGAGNSGNVTIGEDEPDDRYVIAGYGCDAPEALGFTSLTTAGFTVTSSNATSTATCTILIVR
jgi:hypothetical protein